MIAFEDRSIELDEFVAQHIMDGGSMEDLFEDVNLDGKQKIGYFLLVAEKK